VFWSILHRTILWELTRIFLLALVGITTTLLMAGLVAEATQHGLSPGQILAVIPLIIPSTLPYTIPATTLFATCVVYGRLAHDNEILALKSAGVNILRVVWPAVVLGLVMTGVTATLYYHVIPATHHAMRTLFLRDVEDFLYAMLKREGSLKHPKLNYVMIVKRVQGRKLIDAYFMRRDPKRDNKFDIIAHAREAELMVDLHRRQILVHMRQCTITSGEMDRGNAIVQDKVWPVDLPSDFGTDRKTRPDDMVWEEIDENLRELTREREKYEAEIALVSGRLALYKAPDEMAKHLANLRNLKRMKDLEILNLQVEKQKRPALALGCLCFVLVGCPVGIWFSRSDYLSAFITCFLPIVVVYYPLLLCGMNLAKASQLPMEVGIWGANALMGLIALVLLRRLMKN
jgi:lipopolysaccharide export system permease protein